MAVIESLSPAQHWMVMAIEELEFADVSAAWLVPVIGGIVD